LYQRVKPLASRLAKRRAKLPVQWSQREMQPVLAWESLPAQSTAKPNENLLRLEVKASMQKA